MITKIKYEAKYKCNSCSNQVSILLDAEEYQDYIEGIEDGYSLVCSECVIRGKQAYNKEGKDE